MSITKDFVALDFAPVANVTNYHPAHKSNFVQIDSVVRNDGAREAVYQKISAVANSEYTTTVRIGYYPSKDGTESSVSVKMNGWVRYTDSVSGVITHKPLSCTIAVKGPGSASVWDVEGFVTLINNTASWLHPVTGTTFSGAAGDLLKFGVVTGLNALTD